jgi:hypothetical protein
VIDRACVRLAAAAVLVTGAVACGGRSNRAANNSSGERTDTTARSVSRDTGPTGAAASTRQEPGRQGQVAVAQIAADPSSFAGQRVTVRADVGSPAGPVAFTLTDSSQLAPPAAAGASSAGRKHELLLLSPVAAPSQRRDLTISGTVRTFRTEADLRREAPWLDRHSTANFEQLRNRPVIVADSIRTADGRELMAGNVALPAGTGETGARSDEGSASRR